MDIDPFTNARVIGDSMELISYQTVEAFLRAYTGTDGRWALEAERIHIATRGSRFVQGAIGPEMRRVELRLIETTSNLP